MKCGWATIADSPGFRNVPKICNGGEDANEKGLGRRLRRVSSRLPLKAEKSMSRLIRPHTLTLVSDGRRAVFPMPLQQDTEISGAQAILSSDPVTDVVVFAHLPVDGLKE